MRKGCKKLTILFAAAIMAAGAVAFTGCDASFTPLSGDYSSETAAVSNGGFVVEYGKYVYFINGVETIEADNTYGKVTKAALMRILRSDLDAGKNTAETVVPSLMVAADYTSGLYVYGDRIYYATPNNVKNTSGKIERDYLDFKSAKLDGSDVKSYFRINKNDSEYRFVEVENVVYVMYADGTTLHSYNTATDTDTVLAEGTGTHAFHKTDKTNGFVYYTMNVVDGADTENPNQLSYQQIYRVRADATEAPSDYDYEWNAEYLEEHEGKAPYTNLGTIVLDGIGTGSIYTRFSHHDQANALTSNGYTYSIERFDNEGIYFTRKEIVSTGSVGETSWLYYLPISAVNAEGWDSIKGNKTVNGTDGYLDVIAQNTDKASASAIFYIDETDGGKHHYLYVDGSTIKRADVEKNGTGATEEQRIALNVSGATLNYIDSTDSTYKYVYFTRANGNGGSVERAVYNGTAEQYSALGYGENENFVPVKVLNVQHTNSWYPYEVVGGTLFYSDAEQFTSTAYSYIHAVEMKKDGKLMTNSEFELVNDKYEEITDYIEELGEDNDKVSDLINSYFYTQTTKYYEDNLKDAADAGKSETYLFSEEDKAAFKAFADGTSEDAKKFMDGEKSYRTRDYFITVLGAMSEADEELWDIYWHAAIGHYTPPEETDAGLAWWTWTLIGVGIGAVVVGTGLAIYYVYRSKKYGAAENKPVKMVVDTTDDEDIDVYAENVETLQAKENDGVEDGNDSTEEPVAPVEEPAETPAEETDTASAPVEELPENGQE